MMYGYKINLYVFYLVTYVKRQINGVHIPTSMEPKKIVIFDLDDCLVMTVHWYWAGWRMFRDVMVKLGFKKYEIELIGKLNEFDAAGVKLHGFKKERFGEAMVETYEHYCQLENCEPDSETKDGLMDIGMSVFKHRPILYPRTKEVLAYLEGKQYTLYCVTKGDEDVQLEKMHNCGLTGWFKDIHFVPLDKKEAIQSIITANPDISKSDIYFVGNSRKDDMRPAIELGINGILIYEYTWHFDEAEFEGMDKVRELDGLADLMEIL